MSFARLYDEVQLIKGKVSTRWLREQAISLSQINRVKEQWTSALDSEHMRGFYIEGPLEPPVPLLDNESLIVLCRGLPRHWRRLVYTKELMHVFDKPEEKADNPEKFVAQVERFRDPTSAPTPQYQAEEKALWRALAVLCQENRRADYERQLAAKEVSIDFIATALQLPAVYTRHLFREDFLAVVEHIKAE